MKAILAAIDFSPGTDLVVSTAATLARAIDAKVVLLTVLVEPALVKGYDARSRETESITVAHEQSVRQRLAEIQRGLETESVSAEAVLCRGKAAFHILDEVDNRDAAFVVIGSHGHNAVYEMVVGSTTQAVLKAAKIPVIVVPAQTAKPARLGARILAMPFPD